MFTVQQRNYRLIALACQRGRWKPQSLCNELERAEKTFTIPHQVCLPSSSTSNVQVNKVFYYMLLNKNITKGFLHCGNLQNVSTILTVQRQIRTQGSVSWKTKSWVNHKHDLLFFKPQYYWILNFDCSEGVDLFSRLLTYGLVLLILQMSATIVSNMTSCIAFLSYSFQERKKKKRGMWRNNCL